MTQTFHSRRLSFPVRFRAKGRIGRPDSSLRALHRLGRTLSRSVLFPLVVVRVFRKNLATGEQTTHPLAEAVAMLGEVQP